MTTAIGIYRPKGDRDLLALRRTAKLYDVDWLFTIGPVPNRSGDAIPYNDEAHFWRAAKSWRYEHIEVVALETAELATSRLRSFLHPANALYVLGPESGRLPDEFLDKCDHILAVETAVKGALNTATVGAIVLHDRHIKQMGQVWTRQNHTENSTVLPE